MVIAAHRAYSDAVRWLKSARPPRLNGWRLTRRIFQVCFVGSLLLLGAIGLASPQRFGSPGGGPGGSLQWWGLAALLVLCVAWCATKRHGIKAGAERLAEPFRRPLDRLEAFYPATDALLSAPSAVRTRFAIGWVWGPAAIVVLGAFFAASSAYFLVDAILARFQIGWEQPVLAVVNALLSLVVLRSAAKRLSTWRLAFSIHREVTGSY